MASSEPAEPEAIDVDALGELAALQGVVKFPVRIKCATLSWNTLAEGLDASESPTGDPWGSRPRDGSASSAVGGITRIGRRSRPDRSRRSPPPAHRTGRGQRRVEDVEEPAEVGDGQYTEAPLGRSRPGTRRPTSASASTSRPESISSSTAGRGRSTPIWERLVALALAARRGGSHVERPVEEPLFEPDPNAPLGARALGIRCRALRVPGWLPGDGRSGAGQRLDQRDTGHLDRVLHGEKQAGPRPLPGREGQQVDAVEGHRALDHLVTRPAHEDVGQGALAGAVRPHHRMDLTAAHGEADPTEDLASGDARPEALDAQPVPAHGRTTETSSPSSTTR